MSRHFKQRERHVQRPESRKTGCGDSRMAWILTIRKEGKATDGEADGDLSCYTEGGGQSTAGH